MILKINSFKYSFFSEVDSKIYLKLDRKISIGYCILFFTFAPEIKM